MSSEAVNWVLDHSPAEKDMILLMVVMARYMDKNGRGCRASEETLARNMRVLPRQVRKLRAKAAEKGLIKLGDQNLVARYPVGRRPVVFDLVGMPPQDAVEAPRAQGGTPGSKALTSRHPVDPTGSSGAPPVCTFTPDPENENFCLNCGMPPINRRHL